MATAEVLDISQLSSFCSLPATSINALLDAPTVETVRNLLHNISVKAREYDETKSANLKLSVELENAVRGGESKARILKNSVDKRLKEAEELRQRLQTEEQARASFEAELQSLRTSTSSSTEKSSALQARIDSLESSNRDTVSLLESKSIAYDNLAGELTDQHQKTVELRREVTALEQTVQSAKAEANNAKLHEQGLQQEIEHLKRNNDWLDNELKTRSSDHVKFRKEKGARIAELQRQNDDLSSNVDGLTRTEKTLRTRLDEVGQKADDAFSKIQQMQEELVSKEEAFSIELDSANRLAQLMQNSANTERQRQQDLHQQLETSKEAAADEIGRIFAECDTEHREKEVAEQRNAELEAKTERLEAELALMRDRVSMRGSPPQGINGSMTPNRIGSRLGSPNPGRAKSGMSLTQLYSDNNNLKAELEQERRRSEKLGATIEEMMQDVEAQQPQVEELQSEHARLQSDVAEMSSLVDAIGKERDQATKEARKSQGMVESKLKEGEVLRQQLRDLSSQVKVLLMEVHLRSQGLDELSPERHLQLERLAQGQLNEDEMDDTTDTDRFISQNLVTFKNITELEEQNSKLVKVTRELGERMEREEALRKESTATAQGFEDMKQKYERCRDEIKSLITQSESYVRERDIFKRMLLNRGQDVNSISGESMEGKLPATPSRSIFNTGQGSPSSKDMADYAKLLKDMQAHFDAYRQEAATDRSTLKQQVDNLSRSNSELRGDVSRSKSQVTLAHERYEMLQSNYAMLKSENVELQKRSQFYSENAAKQEIRTQQITEDLVEIKGLADSMRNETANLKAEKEFWKGIEKRLSEDNDNLLNEQKRLNTLNANFQNLMNEREHADTETRRRLQVQIENLERELQTTKGKLSEELEKSKRALSRHEYEQQQNQKRLDDLVSSLSSTREELVGAKTSRDHLQARVDELTIQLRSAEERVEVLQPHHSESSTATTGGNHNYVSQEEESSALSKEQELSVQVSELRRDLDLARAELENAKDQVEQYKAISQASEEELQSLNETQELYRQETDRTIEEKNNKVKELEQRITDTSTELASRDSELSVLRSSQAEHGKRLEEQKTSFESEKAQLRDEVERQSSTAYFSQEDLKKQAEIAQQAQQNYENELVKHAEAAKLLQRVRNDYNQLKLELVELKTENESARTNLSQNEESWAESKKHYEREISDLKTGREGLNAQNNRLLQQLDDVSSQIADLRKRKAPEGGDEISTEDQSESTSQSIENLHEIIKYLRREKEIIEVQYSLSETEGKRLKQQLDYTQSQLDETRLRLNQQRRLEQDSERTSLNHNKLMETINELSTFRESNVTLRHEARQAQASLTLKSQQFDELQAQVGPLEAEVKELKNQLETQAGEANLLREDRERWQQRTQDILQKYDRIDPAEMDALKTRLQMLETERDELVSSKASVQEEYDSLSANARKQGDERVAELRSKLTEQFKARSKMLSDQVKEKDAMLQAALKEKQDIEQQLSNAQQELNAAKAEKALAEANSTNNDAQAEVEEGQVDDEAGSKHNTADVQALQDKLLTSETKLSEESSRSLAFQEQLVSAESRVAELEAQSSHSQQIIDGLNTSLGDLRNQQQEQSTLASTAHEADLERLRRDLVQAQQDAEALRATASASESLDKRTTEEGGKSVTEQLTERVEEIRAELEARHNDRLAQIEETFKKRSETMRTQLTNKLADAKEKYRQSIAVEHEQEIEKLKSDHVQELEKLRTRHHDELDELKKQEESRFAQFKEKWASDHPQSQSETTNLASSTDTQAPRALTDISDAEAQDLIRSNNVVRVVLRKNVTTQVDKAKEILSAQLREEHEKDLAEKLAETQSKANTMKDHAVAMEQKRNQLKVSMSENKAKAAQAKLAVIQTAANETPQRPVIEVWDVAKNAKAEVAVAPPSANVASPVVQKPAAASSTSEQVSAPVADSQSQVPKAPVSSFGQPSSFGRPSTFGQPSGFSLPSNFAQSGQTQSPNAAAAGSFGQPSVPRNIQTQSHNSTSSDQQPAPLPPQANATLPQSQPQRPASNNPQASVALPQPVADGQQNTNPINGTSQPQRQPSSQPAGGLPPKPAASGQNNPFSQGAGPAAARSLQQSGLPIARGGSIRGRGNARGRGQGWGGGQSIDTTRTQEQTQGQPQGQPQGRASPTSASLNASARQFVPGNKRPRDEAQEGQHGDGGGNGKRIRGGRGGP
ncbi:MAG: hypothetical protein Q9191_002941 [Dirinaria sp. TL-2023a]